MTKRNINFNRLKSVYLFPEINARKQKFLESNPNAKLISLGIGDTTEPLPTSVASPLAWEALHLGTKEGYSGYGPEQGSKDLRVKIASRIYHNKVNVDEIFISDGAKCDLGRLQLLFGNDVSIAVQDPSYPVYVDGSIISGVKNIHFMPCNPENQFFPDLNAIPRVDIIYYCSPNNPTGTVGSRQQLEQLVAYAKKNKCIIIFDAAYACYIQDPNIPKSIFEIPGARDVAIELGSFSKLAGFTGVRLGWSIVPNELKYEDGGSVKADWHRLMSTIFNGASNIAQRGGEAVLDDKGWHDVNEITRFYMENARILREVLESGGHKVFGGTSAPYLWVSFKGRKSWDVFQELLERFQLITTPGIGFGPGGDEYVRMTAFGSRENILEAAKRLRDFKA